MKVIFYVDWENQEVHTEESFNKQVKEAVEFNKEEMMNDWLRERYSDLIDIWKLTPGEKEAEEKQMMKDLIETETNERLDYGWTQETLEV